MVSKLANAQMDGAERYANFVAMFMHKLDEMARKVEKAHSMKLERHARMLSLRTTSLFLSLTFTVDPSRRSSVLGRCPVRI